MNVAIGLGNPGEQYAESRHNVGCMVVDELARSLELSWHSAKKIHAQTAKGHEVLLLKSQTYMNETGKALRAGLEYYKITPTSSGHYSQVWVVLDDLDLELGSYKVQFGTGPKVHNGLLSIYQELGTAHFWHVRVGIDGREGNRLVPGREYVLQNFNSEEKYRADQAVSEVAAQLRHKMFM